MQNDGSCLLFYNKRNSYKFTFRMKFSTNYIYILYVKPSLLLIINLQDSEIRFAVLLLCTCKILKKSLPKHVI